MMFLRKNNYFTNIPSWYMFVEHDQKVRWALKLCVIFLIYKFLMEAKKWWVQSHKRNIATRLCSHTLEITWKHILGFDKLYNPQQQLLFFVMCNSSSHWEWILLHSLVYELLKKLFDKIVEIGLVAMHGW